MRDTSRQWKGVWSMEAPHMTDGSVVDRSHTEPGQVGVPSCTERGLGGWRDGTWGGCKFQIPTSLLE